MGRRILDAHDGLTLVATGAWNGEFRIWKIDDGALMKALNASPGLQTAAGR